MAARDAMQGQVPVERGRIKRICHLGNRDDGRVIDNLGKLCGLQNLLFHQAFYFTEIFIAYLILHVQGSRLDEEVEPAGFELVRIEFHLAAEVTNANGWIVPHPGQHSSCKGLHSEPAGPNVDDVPVRWSLRRFRSSSRSLGHAANSAWAPTLPAV